MAAIIRRLWKKVFAVTAESVTKQYIKRDRNYKYKGFRLKIFKGVFHPGLFRSTRIFAEWLEQQTLNNYSILELGCGSGLLSLVCAAKGANVIAVDINSRAVENAKLNAAKNDLAISALQSDLFTAVPGQRFDMVLINPPYFPKTPASGYDHAWFCGENFEYFKKLFSQVAKRPATENYYMIVSDLCDLSSISNIAANDGFKFIEEYSKKVSGEQFFIFRIVPDAN